MKDLNLADFLSKYLGEYKNTSRENIGFNCPFCGEKKHNFEVNIDRNSDKFGYWHCWVCNAGGRRIENIFKKLNYSDFEINKIKEKIYGENIFVPLNIQESENQRLINLIKKKIYNNDKKFKINNLETYIKNELGFEYLIKIKQKILSKEIDNQKVIKLYNLIYNYLINERKLTDIDIERYKIMTNILSLDNTVKYKKFYQRVPKILFPNFEVIYYNSDNLEEPDNQTIEKFEMNYYVIRNLSDYYIDYQLNISENKYKDRIIKYEFPSTNIAKPKSEIIFFDWLIEYNYPIVLTEGIFDSITINQSGIFQSIPLLGKSFNNNILLEKLLKHNTKIIIFLDLDTLENQENKKLAKQLYKYGLRNIYYIDYQKVINNEETRKIFQTYKDINEMSVDNFLKMIKLGIKKYKFSLI